MRNRVVEPDTDLEEVAALLSTLVSIDTSNPPGRERECAEYVERELASWGLQTALVDEPFSDRPQVLAETGAAKDGESTLILNGHMDVVPAGAEDDWSVDPFGGAVDDGRVYGRGATDMKGGLTAAMLAGRTAAESDAIDGRVVLAFSVGEETGEPGTLRLLERIDGDYGVVLEPTELQVHTASKGTAWYTVRIEGESSHASRPHLGSNPLLALFSVVQRLEAYREEVAEQTHPLLGEAMCTPTMCSAGSKENVVPSSAEIRFDRRFLPGDDVAQIDDEMAALFAPLREDGFRVSVERTQTFQPAEVSPDEEIAQTFLNLAEPHVSGSPGPAGKVGGTDQRFFINEADIPAIVWGPGDAGQAHTVDESAEIEPVLDAVEVLCRAFDELLVSAR